MKRNLWALGLCAGLALTLAACTGQSADPQEKLVGTWTCKYDFLDQMADAALEGAPEMEEYFHMDEFLLPLELTFTQDGTFSLVLNQEEMDQQMERFKEAVVDASMEYTQSALGEMYGDQGDWEELLESVGASREDVAAAMDQAMDPLMEQMYQESNTQGQFRATDKELFTSDDVETEPSDSDGKGYTLDGDTLTIDFSQEELGELTFTRAK